MKHFALDFVAVVAKSVKAISIKLLGLSFVLFTPNIEFGFGRNNVCNARSVASVTRLDIF